MIRFELASVFHLRLPLESRTFSLVFFFDRALRIGSQEWKAKLPGSSLSITQPARHLIKNVVARYEKRFIIPPTSAEKEARCDSALREEYHPGADQKQASATVYRICMNRHAPIICCRKKWRRPTWIMRLEVRGNGLGAPVVRLVFFSAISESVPLMGWAVWHISYYAVSYSTESIMLHPWSEGN